MSADIDEAPAGLPPWMATFADLMALLMCFFVLLLSFSEMDVLKYKQVAGSMAQAFGVQNDVVADGIPKGTSVIAQEFSPGRPQPTVENVVQQQTVDSSQNSLQTGQSDYGQDSSALEVSEEAARQILVEKLQALQEQTLEDVKELEEALASDRARNRVGMVKPV